MGHRAPSLEATYLAAVLAAGDGALLSGLAAAHLHGLVKGPPPPAEVTARTERRIERVRTHRCRFLDAQDATVVRGIPVTTVPRTLVDIASVLSLDALARACHEAGVRPAERPGSEEAPPSHPRGCPGNPEQARERIPRAPATRWPRASADQPSRRRPPRRLQVARAPADGSGGPAPTNSEVTSSAATPTPT